MVCRHFWAQALFHAVHPDFYVEFPAMRSCLEPGLATVCANLTGRGRRRTATAGAGDPCRYVSSRETRVGIFTLWGDRYCRAFHRPHARRMDYRQLFVALDFL